VNDDSTSNAVDEEDSVHTSDMEMLDTAEQDEADLSLYRSIDNEEETDPTLPEHLLEYDAPKRRKTEYEPSILENNSMRGLEDSCSVSTTGTTRIHSSLVPIVSDFSSPYYHTYTSFLKGEGRKAHEFRVYLPLDIPYEIALAEFWWRSEELIGREHPKKKQELHDLKGMIGVFAADLAKWTQRPDLFSITLGFNFNIQNHVVPLRIQWQLAAKLRLFLVKYLNDMMEVRNMFDFYIFGIESHDVPTWKEIRDHLRTRTLEPFVTLVMQNVLGLSFTSSPSSLCINA
jgi:hypothetical protein